MRWNRVQCEMCVLGILLARCMMFGMAPFGAAFYIAADMEGHAGVLLFTLIIAATAGAAGVIEAIKFGMVIVVMVLLKRIFKLGEGVGDEITTALLAGIVAAAMGLSELLWQDKMVHVGENALLTGILVFAAVLLLQKGIHFLVDDRRMMREQEVLGMCAVAFGAIAGMPEIVPWFSLAKAVAVFLVFYMAYRYGMREGVFFGAVSGGVLAMFYHNPVWVGCICILGLGAGILRGMGRLGSLLSGGVSAMLLYALWQQEMFTIMDGYALAVGMLVFAVLPKSWTVQVQTTVGKRSVLIEDAVWMATRNQIKEFSESFKKLKGAMENMTPQAEEPACDQVLERVINGLCSECSQCQSCWGDHMNRMYEETSAALEAISQNQAAEPSHLPKGFGIRCKYKDPFFYKAQHEFELVQLEKFWNQKVLEGREAIAEQLSEVASILDDFSMELYEEKPMDERREAALYTAFRRKNVRIQKAAVITDHHGHEEIFLTAKSGKGQMMTTREAAAIVSRTLKKPMQVQDGNKVVIGKEYEVVTFIQKPVFHFLQGVAREKKDGECISGDNFSFLDLPCGQAVMMLADGMGSGDDASHESELLIEMLEQMLTAGFSKKSAIKLLNAVLASPSKKPLFSTLDLCMLDLYTGVCESVKIGAAATFIESGDKIETLISGTFPMGVFPQITMEPSVRKLKDGDIIFMMSDGVMDAVIEEDKEGFIKEEIKKLSTENPKEMAQRLLDAVLLQAEGIKRDDMTILVLGFWKR